MKKSLFLIATVFFLLFSITAVAQKKARSTGTNISKQPIKPKPVPFINQDIALKDLVKMNFVKGNIYFSGADFANVVQVNASSYAALETYLARCIPGSVVTFESVVYKNEDGMLSIPFSKSYTIQAANN